jgi:hypothetical protein
MLSRGAVSPQLGTALLIAIVALIGLGVIADREVFHANVLHRRTRIINIGVSDMRPGGRVLQTQADQRHLSRPRILPKFVGPPLPAMKASRLDLGGCATSET